MNSFFKKRGFSLIEISLVMGLVALLLGYMSLNVLNGRNKADLNTVKDTFATDFKNQQTKAMAGDTEGRGTPDTYGIYINSNSYTLFHGSTYTPTEASNFKIDMPNGVSLSTTFPQSKIVFAQGSGEITPFSDSTNTIRISNTSTNETRTIQVNKYGAIISNN